RFDTGALAGDPAWWGRLLGHSPVIPQLAVAMAAATLVLGGPRLRDELRRLSGRLGPPHPWRLLFLALLLAFAGLTRLTAFVLEGEARSSPCPGAWVVAWGVLAFATLAFGVAVALPPGLWLPLARRGA